MELESIKALIRDYEDLSIYASSKVHEAVEEIIKKYHITFEQLCVLRMLEQRPGLSPVQIAERLSINKSGVSIRVNRMIGHGLIEKKKIDNRSFGLYNTGKGGTIYREGEQKIQALVGAWIQEVGEKGSREFIRVYKKINEIIIKTGIEK